MDSVIRALENKMATKVQLQKKKVRIITKGIHIVISIV